MASVKYPSFPNIDFSKLDFSKVDLTKLDLSKIDFSKIDWSKLDPTKLDLGKLDLGKVDLGKLPKLPAVDTEAVNKATKAAKDSAYIGIGLAVLAFQKAQVLRRDATKSISDQLENNRAQLDGIVKGVRKQALDLLASRTPAAT